MGLSVEVKGVVVSVARTKLNHVHFTRKLISMFFWKLFFCPLGSDYSSD